MARLPHVAAAVLALLVLAGSGLSEERTVRRARTPALSPDGSRIVFNYRGDLWIVPREGGRARRLTTHPAYESGAVWSPDGKRVAFNSIRNGAYDVFLISPEGGAPTRVTEDSGYDLVEDWYDANTLLIRTSRAGSSDLALASLDGTTPRHLTRTFLDGESYACVVPGGEEILLSDKSAYHYRRKRFAGSAASDIWALRVRGEGPRWRRLVDSDHMDLRPWSDGKGTVWFVSNRSGTPNLWTVPLAGGEPRAVTRLAASGVRRPSFSRDGRFVAFDHEDRIHVMALPDGRPEPVDIRIEIDAERNPLEHRAFTSGVDEFEVSPDGKLLAVVVHGEVFLTTVEDGGLARNLTGTPGRETQVAWGSDSRTLYFVSDRSGNRDVFRHDVVEGTTDRLTETRENEAWPTPSPDGKRVVWIEGTEKLRVVGEVPGGLRRKRLGRARKFAELSDVETGEVGEEEAKGHAALAERIADGETAEIPKAAMPFFLRAMAAADPGTTRGMERIQRLSAALREVTGYPMPTLDSEVHGADHVRQVALGWAIYWRDRRKPETPFAFQAPEGFQTPGLTVHEVAEPIVVPASLADMALWGQRPYVWAPDSRWLAYPERGPDYGTDVRILDATDGTVHRVTAHPPARHPRFSGDGKWLSFVSSTAEDDDVYLVRLGVEEREFPDDSLREALGEDGDTTDSKNAKKGKDEGPDPVEIAFDRIAERVVQGTSWPTFESEPLLSPDGETIFFLTDLGDSRELWSLPAPHVDGPRRPKQLTRGERPSAVRISPDGKRLFYISSGRVRSIALSGSGGKSHGFRAEMAIDREKEMAFVLEEALWLLRTWFYDPGLHGLDWRRVAERYRGLLADTDPGLDFEVLLDGLCAELDASHLGASGGDSRAESEPSTGRLGVDLDDGFLVSGRAVVTAVLVDGPAAHPEVGLEPGDEILAVDGQDLGQGVNLSLLLRGTVGRRVELRVRPAEGEVREVVIRPCDDRRARDLRYESWVRERKEKVREWSKGRLAYMHVRSMDSTSLNRIRREIVVEAAGKDGAIVDVRYNGGGWTAVHILDTLARRPYVMRSFRKGTRVSENAYRDDGIEIPLAALTNHASFSNAEIFSEGFRRLGLGPVVGVPTAGGVIGTGSWRLLNGMRMRRPSWAAHTLDGENLEGRGRPVTHRVENAPGREGHEEDRQLRRAVDLLLAK